MISHSSANSVQFNSNIYTQMNEQVIFYDNKYWYQFKVIINHMKIKHVIHCFIIWTWWNSISMYMNNQLLSEFNKSKHQEEEEEKKKQNKSKQQI